MRIVSVSENLNFEKRIAITPEIAKKYISNSFEVFLSENYGEHLGFKDNHYKELGVNILKDEILKDIPEAEISRMEFDMKDQMIRQTIMTTQEDVKEMQKTLERIEDKVYNR